MKRRDATDKLHLPPRMNYDCLMCGRGCTDFWEIPLDTESEEELSRLPLKEHQQRAHEMPPFVDSKFDKGERALCRVDDVCVFMSPDHKCSLHTAFGHLAKPQTCIDFPFRYVDTPHGTFVGLSFACTAVLQDHGGPIETKRQSLADNYIRSIHVKHTENRPNLTGRIAIDYEAYDLIERAFDEILDIPKISIGTKLLCQSVLLDLLIAAFETARLGENSRNLTEEERHAANSAKDSEIAAGMIAQFRRDHWGKLLLMAQKRPKSAAFHRAFIGLISTFRQALWRDANRLKALTYISRHYLRHALRLGRVHLQPFTSPFKYSAFAELHADFTPGSPFDLLLTRYFRHAIFRKDLLLGESIRTGHRFMLMHYALISWYVTGIMVEQKQSHQTEETIREALRHVEKYYVHHSTYGRYLERQPVLGTLIDWAINSRSYAGSMIGRPI